MFVRSCCTVWILLTGLAAAAAVFVEKHEADTVLQRQRRANSGFLEELQQGNLERECIEEVCDYEEAREVFEDDAKTKQFWLTYERRDPCLVNPCKNGGSCVFMRTYQCVCPAGFGGQYCERGVEQLLQCLYQNGGCEHFCDSSGDQHRCLCADGFTLAADGRKCDPQAEFPCGRPAPQEPDLDQGVTGQTRLVGSNHCPKGECPWQVLVQLDGNSHCGGVLIGPDWVITAAHCIHGNDPRNLTVVAGEHNLDVEEGTEQRVPVANAIAHEGYVHETADSDIALLRLSRPITPGRHAIPVCLPTKQLAERELLQIRYHVVSGWGQRITGGNQEKRLADPAPVSPFLRKFTVPMIQLSKCSPSSAHFNFSSNLLCAGYMEIDQQSCRGDDGSPLVTLYGSTHFLTGVVAWGRGCSPKGIYGVYTNVANYLDWVERVMKNPPPVTAANEQPAARTAALDQLEQKHV